MSRISKISNKKTLINIYKIIRKDLGKKISNNKNGIFFDMNKLSDFSIEEIIKILSESESKESSESDTKFTYTPYNEDINDNINNCGPKLSNKEKNLLKNIKEKY